MYLVPAPILALLGVALWARGRLGSFRRLLCPDNVLFKATGQAQGVPAGIVYKAEDLFDDPQLKHREHFTYLEHQVIGRHAYDSGAIRFSKTPHRLWKAAPCLGEDNEYVYKHILDFSDDDISDLLAEGVITTEADLSL